MLLVVFMVFVGLWIVLVQMNLFVVFCLVLFIVLGGGVLGVLNMWYDSDIDVVMKWMVNCFVFLGCVLCEDVLVVGLVLLGLLVMMFGLVVNWFVVGFLVFMIFFYVVVYMIWLKCVMLQNIVIGGVVGVFLFMIGWVCVMGGIGIEFLLMFVLIFFWMLLYFWVLVLFMNSDYLKVGVLMLLVMYGCCVMCCYIFGYMLVLVFFVIWLGFILVGGLLYLVVLVILNVMFIVGGWQILCWFEEQVQVDGYKVEKCYFCQLLYYIFLYFLVLLVQYWMGGL